MALGRFASVGWWNESQDEPSALELLIRALERRDTLSDREKAALEGIAGEVRDYSAGDTLVHAGDAADQSTLLLTGLLGRAFYMPEGRRQIVAVHVPGDFVDLHALLLKRLEHDVVALTNVRVIACSHAALRRLTETEPHLARMLWLLTVIDAAIHREWIGRLGHSAAVRVAHLLCELQARLATVGLADDGGFPLTLTQADIGDMTGLTPVHVNRTLRKLREAGLAIVRDGTVSIQSLAALRDFAGFDLTYLYLESRAR